MINFSSAAINSPESRLPRLLKYLSQDPSNYALLCEVFEAAYAEKNWQLALEIAGTGSQENDKISVWQLRIAEVLIAKGEMQDAKTLLLSIIYATTDFSDFKQAVTHNLAYIDFCLGQTDDCLRRLGPLLDGENLPKESSSRVACSQLWLRALHHKGNIEQAMAWASQRSSKSNFSSELGAIGSLIAIDANELEIAEHWAQSAQSESMPLEGWVSHASLALGRNDAARAEFYAKRAVELSPADGRSWSVLAFSQLAGQKMDQADACFREATRLIPDHIGTWHGRAWSALLQNSLQSAEEYFLKAIELDRNFADSHGGLAVLYYRTGQRENAFASAERALRLDAQSLTGKFAIALLKGQLDSQDAINEFARSTEIFSRRKYRT